MALTTVSATIPGRPPLHERSASAPGTAGYGISRTTVNSGKAARNTPWPVVIGAVVKRKSLSPVNLSRLVIPSEDMGSSTTELRYQCDQPGLDEESDEGTPPLPPPKSPWMEERATPMKRCPTAPANMSAPCRSNGQPQTQTQHQLQQTPSQTHVDGIPMTAPEERGYPRPWATPTRSQSPSGHLRQMSEGGIMERGRPTQRLIEPISRQQSAANSVGTTASADLPSGVRASEVPAAWSGSDIATLQEQAREQAADFRILAAKDVQSISRVSALGVSPWPAVTDKLLQELRSLDERCEYLRRTLNSLRMGRRGLHTRMVAYLKSPRMAKFSRESMLKQEEALGELDGSIDDWVAKLDRAESRRTRIRQKLLEHVAATLSLKPVEANVDGQSSSEDAAIKPEAAEPSQDAAREPAPGPTVESTLGPTTYSPDFNKACPTGSSSGRDSQETAVGDDDTPPRTPERPSTPERFDRRAVESIKIYAEPDVYPIYADADVYALLEDVEQEISNMTDACEGNHEGVSEPWISSFAKTPMI